MAAQNRFLKVSMGTLPDNFCPTNPQQLGDAIASRLIVEAPVAFSTFVTGSVAPTSDEGPWLKDGLEWWVWDEDIGAYRPMRFPWTEFVVGCQRQRAVLGASMAIPAATWGDVVAITISDDGGEVQIHAQGTIRFSISGGLDFAMRLYDGTTELSSATIEIDGVTATTADVPFSLHFSETVPIGTVKTYTLQISGSAGGGTLLATATKGGQTVTNMTSIDSLQFFNPQ